MAHRWRWTICVPTVLLALVAAFSAAVAAAPCERALLARVPLRDDGGFLSIPAAVGGQPVRLMLDTGSDAGLITPQAAGALGLETDRTTRIRMQGTGGEAHATAVARIRSLAIGSLTLDRLSIPVGPLPGAPKLAPPIIGFLGGDVLSQFDLDIDLNTDPGHSSLSLWRIRTGSLACAPPPVWPAPFKTVQLSAQGVRLSLDAFLDGTKVDALLDTGARSLLVSLDAAHRAGVAQAVLDTEPGGITSGVDMRPQTYHWHRFDSLRIGGETIANPVLTVAPLSGPFDMLLGTDWMKGRDIWISYTQNKIFVK